jgi:hypothetical protein
MRCNCISVSTQILAPVFETYTMVAIQLLEANSSDVGISVLPGTLAPMKKFPCLLSFPTPARGSSGDHSSECDHMATIFGNHDGFSTACCGSSRHCVRIILLRPATDSKSIFKRQNDAIAEIEVLQLIDGWMRLRGHSANRNQVHDHPTSKQPELRYLMSQA